MTRSPLSGCDPLTHLPGRIVPHMLRVTALQVSHPVVLVVLMKADDPARNGAASIAVLTHDVDD